MTDPAVTVRALRKSYGSAEAVRGIDLEVRHGEVFAFLGPNGAGKTTTTEILEGYRERDGGEVSVLGVDPARPTREWRSRIGIVLQAAKPEHYLTVRETVAEYADFYPHPRSVDETIEQVGLTESAHKRGGQLSGGQQRRLDVALALVGDPDLIFMDEPTTGFDPAARRNAWEMIGGLRDLGKTIFLTTHFMDEAQALADRVAIIRAGAIVAAGRAVGAGRARPAQLHPLHACPRASPPPTCRGPARAEAGRAVLEVERPLQPLAAITAWALERGYELPDLEVERPSLEDVYLELTEEGA